MGCGTAVEADGEEMGFVICLVDGVGAALVGAVGMVSSISECPASLHGLSVAVALDKLSAKSNRRSFMHSCRGAELACETIYSIEVGNVTAIGFVVAYYA